VFLFDEVKKNHYEVLGIPNTATDDEIKRAYFGMVRKYQPDRFPDEFKEIRAAYEILMDGKKRADYDAIGGLPVSVRPLFHEAQRFDRLGRSDRAAELYRTILKDHPELDRVREHYARALYGNEKTGKAIEVWEELCRRNPDNPRYAKELGQCYLERGWTKKAQAEARRSLALDRSFIEGWSLLIFCAAANIQSSGSPFDELGALATEALEAVKGVKTDEWRKIFIHVHAFLAAGIKGMGAARDHAREIIRLIREGGQEGRQEGQSALKEILFLVPPESLAKLYPEFREMADLLPNTSGLLQEELETIRLGFEIEGLEGKKIPSIFTDLLKIVNADYEDEEYEFEVTAIEYHLLDDKKTYEPHVRRLKAEFPELYALHSSFFDEFLNARDTEKMLRQRSKKIKKMSRHIDFGEEDPESEQPVTVRRSQPKVGRNDPCPCGSGKKYKHCCGA
jgi:tetratricopeptide (TPR) repeat protein